MTNQVGGSGGLLQADLAFALAIGLTKPICPSSVRARGAGPSELLRLG